MRRRTLHLSRTETTICTDWYQSISNVQWLITSVRRREFHTAILINIVFFKTATIQFTQFGSSYCKLMADCCCFLLDMDKASTARPCFAAKRALEIIHRIAILELQLPVTAGNIIKSIVEELKLENLIGAATICSRMICKMRNTFYNMRVKMDSSVFLGSAIYQ